MKLEAKQRLLVAENSDKAGVAVKTVSAALLGVLRRAGVDTGVSQKIRIVGVNKASSRLDGNSHDPDVVAKGKREIAKFLVKRGFKTAGTDTYTKVSGKAKAWVRVHSSYPTDMTVTIEVTL
jgi:hypothetical protein